MNAHAHDFGNVSTADKMRALGLFEDYWDSLNADQRVEKFYDWKFWARQDQMLPPGGWRIWLLMAGRGFGKTRVLSEVIREWAKTNQYTSFVGATADDVNNIFVDGESGVLATCHPDERPHWAKSQRKLVWRNGATTMLFSADAPERLRGKQHMKIAMDEVAAWGVSGAGGGLAATTQTDAEATQYAFDMAKFGLRLGKKPQMVIATTPRPIPLLQDLLEQSQKENPRVIITAGSTLANQTNLAEDFIEDIVDSYSGTRLGRQELYGELLFDFPGALWTTDMLDASHRGPACPGDPDRVVVAVDPSGAGDAKKAHDEIGIVVVAMKVIEKRKYFWVLADWTMSGSPETWAAEVIKAYKYFTADRVVAETNYGGAMVEAVIRQADHTVSYREVKASRGKVQRAEPVAALYEQGRCFHVSPFEKLEKQMESFTITGYQGKGSPDRVDALVWAITDLMAGKVAPRASAGGKPRRNYYTGRAD